MEILLEKEVADMLVLKKRDSFPLFPDTFLLDYCYQADYFGSGYALAGQWVTAEQFPKDLDLLVSPLPNTTSSLFSALIGAGYSEITQYQEDLLSFTKGIWNVIVCTDLARPPKMMCAQGICQKLVVRNKEDRIMVFNAVCGK